MPMNRTSARSGTTIAGALILAAGVVLFYSEIFYFFSVTRFFGGALEFIHSLGQIDDLAGLHRIVLLERYYPPLYSVYLFVPLHLFGLDHFPVILWNSLLVIGGGLLAALSLRRLGAGGVHLGLAFLFYVLTPAAVVYSKTLVLENGLVFFVGLSFLLLTLSREFRNRWISVALGICLGLGMLMKWTFGAYLLGPCLLAFLGIFYDLEAGQRRAFEGRRLVNVLICGVVAAAVCSPWYLGPFDPVAWIKSAPNDAVLAQYSYPAQVVYSFKLLGTMMGNLWLVLISVPVVLLSARRRLAGAILVAGVLLPLLIFAIPPHIEDRYMYPMLALWSVGVALALAATKPPILRRILIAAVLALLAWAHADSFIGLRGEPLPSAEVRIHRDARLFWATVRGDVILSDLAEQAEAAGEGSIAFSVHPFFKSSHLNAKHLLYEILRNPRYARIRFIEHDRFLYEEFSRDLKNGVLDYVALECGPTGDCKDLVEPVEMTLFAMKGGFYDPHRDLVLEPFPEELVWSDLDYLEAHYALLKSYEFDDAGRIFIYRRNAEAAEGMN